jgi:hypothetical protein
MSMLAEVAAAAGVTKADVARFLTHGGTTAQDWVIARAIEAAGGRQAQELILTAGRDRMIAETWDSSPGPARVAPTSPHATYDREVVIYAEDAAGLVTDRPEQAPAPDEDPVEEDGAEAAEELAVAVHAEIAAYAGSADVAKRIVTVVAARPTLAEARVALYRGLKVNAATRRFTRRHPAPTTAALAA